MRVAIVKDNQKTARHQTTIDSKADKSLFDDCSPSGQEESLSNQISGFTCNACAIRSSPLLQPHAIPAPDSQIPAPATMIKGNKHVQAPVERTSSSISATEQYTAVTCHNTSNV